MPGSANSGPSVAPTLASKVAAAMAALPRATRFSAITKRLALVRDHATMLVFALTWKYLQQTLAPDQQTILETTAQCGNLRVLQAWLSFLSIETS